MSYEIATDVYQGPFDLLLQLIMSDDVDIWEIQLSAIIQAFLEEGQQMQEQNIDLDVATEFLLIASTLIEIKVKRLLPKPDAIELDEELLAYEYRDLLLARLLECKTFKDVANVFQELMDASAKTYPRAMAVEEPFFSLTPDPLSATKPEKLRDAFIRVFTAPEKEEVQTMHLHDSSVSVKEAVEIVLNKIEPNKQISFKDMMQGAKSKLYIVVCFLAILELYKQGSIEIDQSETLGDLSVSLIGSTDSALESVNADDWGES